MTMANLMVEFGGATSGLDETGRGMQCSRTPPITFKLEFGSANKHSDHCFTVTLNSTLEKLNY